MAGLSKGKPKLNAAGRWNGQERLTPAPSADVFLAMFICFVSLQAVASCILFVGGKQPRFDQL